MAEPLEVDPTISKLIQLIEEQDNAIRELKYIIDGSCTCIKFILETINGHIIETQMKTASNEFNSFELYIYIWQYNIYIYIYTYMLETNSMNVFSNI